MNDGVALVFTKVLDELELGLDEPEDSAKISRTRVDWDAQVPKNILQSAILEMAVSSAPISRPAPRPRHYAFRKVSRSALIVSASVVGMPCGKLL